MYVLSALGVSRWDAAVTHTTAICTFGPPFSATGRVEPSITELPVYSKGELPLPSPIRGDEASAAGQRAPRGLRAPKGPDPSLYGDADSGRSAAIPAARGLFLGRSEHRQRSNTASTTSTHA